MSNHFADRLTAAIKAKKTPTCVGIDPSYEQLPADITDREGFDDPNDSECLVDAVGEFCRRVIRIVAPMVSAVKINSAFFEQYFWDGIETYYELVQEARSHGLIVIGDVKRADIGNSAEMYARGHMTAPSFDSVDAKMLPDAITVNPYFGSDGIKPFVDAARKHGKGVFVLVATSNESAGEIQGLKLADGDSVVERVGRMVNTWAGDAGLVGSCGYSSVGAVASPRDPGLAARLRATMPNCIFLVPGVGAQGRGMEQIAPCFKADGTGALVTASRSVLYAFEEMKYVEMYASEWEKCVEHACRDFVNLVATVAPR